MLSKALQRLLLRRQLRCQLRRRLLRQLRLGTQYSRRCLVVIPRLILQALVLHLLPRRKYQGLPLGKLLLQLLGLPHRLEMFL